MCMCKAAHSAPAPAPVPEAPAPAPEAPAPKAGWILAAEGESCEDACGGECDLDGMKDFMKRRISKPAAVNDQWSDAKDAPTCTQARNSGSLTALPLVYGDSDCRAFPDVSGYEVKTTCSAVPALPRSQHKVRRMCMCKAAQ